MKAPLLLAICAVSLLVSGCAAWQCVPFPNQAQRIDDHSKARIYVILDGSALPPPDPDAPNIPVAMNVSDDGQFIGALGRGGLLCWERPPGETIITCTAVGASSLTLNVEPDNVYYVFQHLIEGNFGVRNQLVLEDEYSAQELLKYCHAPKKGPPPPRFFAPVNSAETR